MTLLVVTHELGHLCFAKLFHTRVRRFYVFFNWKFSIFKAKKFDGKWHFLFFNAETPESWNEENLRPEDQNNTLWVRKYNSKSSSALERMPSLEALIFLMVPQPKSVMNR